MATNVSVQRVISLNKVFAKTLMNVSKIKQVPVGHMETALILKVASIALATLVLLLQLTQIIIMRRWSALIIMNANKILIHAGLMESALILKVNLLIT